MSRRYQSLVHIGGRYTPTGRSAERSAPATVPAFLGDRFLVSRTVDPGAFLVSREVPV